MLLWVCVLAMSRLSIQIEFFAETMPGVDDNLYSDQ